MSNVEPEPAAAAALFPTGIEQARQFAQNLARSGEERGLIGPLELPRLWTRHILNSALVAPLLRPGRIGDVGSGAGLPGIVLAIARPDVQVTLIEPMERRVEWLKEQTRDLGLENVAVLRSRAEDAVLDEPLDQVTARAVSALKTLLTLTAPLVRHGGELLLMKGANVDAEIAAAQKQLRQHQVRDYEVIVLGEDVVGEPTRVFRAVVGR